MGTVRSSQLLKRSRTTPLGAMTSSYCSVETPCEGSGRICNGATMKGCSIIYHMLTCNTPLKHLIKLHAELSQDISSFKILPRNGGKKRKERHSITANVLTMASEEAGPARPAVSLLFQTTKQDSSEEVISRLPRKLPEGFYSCLTAKNSKTSSLPLLQKTQTAKAPVWPLYFSPVPWGTGNEPKWASNQARNVNSVLLSTL